MLDSCALASVCPAKQRYWAPQSADSQCGGVAVETQGFQSYDPRETDEERESTMKWQFFGYLAVIAFGLAFILVIGFSQM
jgi:hypothetical protein